MKIQLFDPRFRRFRHWVYGIIGGFLLIPIGLIVWVSFNLPDMEALENTEADLSTVVYSRDGEILGNYFLEQNRIRVSLDEIPPHLKDALIATEDYRFYDHSGIDLWAQFRAVGSILTGGGLQGGSTLTMQLARNLYDEQVGRSRSVGRKLKEMIASGFLERRYTKEEILMHYLNTVPFGGVRYGVQSAAQYYFGKDCAALEPHESALLVGLLKGASYYNPYRYPERATGRRNTVLGQMVKYEFLTGEAADSIQRLPLGLKPDPGQDHNKGLAPYFRTHLQAWLKDWAKENGYNMYTDGLRVYTTIDARLQRHAEAAVRKHLSAYQAVFNDHIRVYRQWMDYEKIVNRAITRSARYNVRKSQGMKKAEILKTFDEKRKMKVYHWAPPFEKDTVMTPRDSLRYYADMLEMGMVTIDPNNGHILAWVGGVDHRFFQYDHVNTGKRQVGSTFKPFVYTAAFDNGWSPCRGISNEPLTVPLPNGTKWSPKNADGRYTPCVPLRKALAQSINVPTARLMEIVGPRTVAEYAYRMGIQTQLEEVYSLALGTTDLQVLELASAYTTFANMGRWVEPHFVTRIEDRNGNVLETFVPNSRTALSEETAYLMIDMLRAVVNGGTAVGLRYEHQIPGTVDIGGKTGTTNKNTDGWFVGFTPRYCTAVWVGHADQAVHFQTTALGQGAKLALPIWGYYMKAVYEDPDLGLKPRRFVGPKDLKVETDCRLFERHNPKVVCGAKRTLDPENDADNPYSYSEEETDE